ncbi:MAG: outer membrane protein assembly factor BamA [Chlorobiaceae bacterium]|nr:outer membrane protein assembly factor BamA [Chlorobiaceae bacterium]NTV26956.1 outer membrane protein assembly factor BamA [Chlorobiaceae bacterium]
MKIRNHTPGKTSGLLILLVLLNSTSGEAAAKAGSKQRLTVRKPAAAAPAPASSPAYESRTFTVHDITISGLSSISDADLLKSLPIKKSDKISIPGPELPSAMQYLWNLQYFSDIRVEKAELGNREVNLRFVVTELPVLESYDFEGYHKFNAKELDKTAALKPGRRISEQDLLNAVTRIEKQYAAKGYLTAGAEYKLIPAGQNRVKAHFVIHEGSKVVIEQIHFHGNKAFKESKLRSTFKETSQNSWWRKIFGQPKLDNDKYADDKNLLIEFYRNNGYRDARVLRDSISYTPDKKGMNLDIFVDEGPKYTIRNVVWLGNTKDFATTDILNTTFAIKKGDLYNAKRINERLNFSQDHSDVSSLYLDRGYLSFRAKLEEQVVQPNQVDLIISMTEGDQFTINNISIKGNTKTKDHVIRRELYTLPGETFSRKDVVRSVREISMLNYFDPETISPDIQPDPEKNQVDLTYNVTEKQTDTFNASVGYSGSTGMTGALGLTFNNFSLGDIFHREAYKPLPHGDGQKLSFQWQFGSDNYRNVSMSISEPWAFGTPTSVGFTAFKTHTSYDYTNDSIDNPKTIDQYGTILSIGRRLTWPDDYFSVSWRLKYLHSKGGFVSFITESNAPEEADEYSITQTISRNSIDNPIFPRHGSKNVLTAQLAGGVLPGSVDFYKFTGTSSWFFPLKKNLVLNLFTQHGYLSTFKKDDYIPYTEYFYMGGNGMSTLPTVPLRGYPDRSIGQQFEGENDLYGGQVYSKFTTELRYPLTLSPGASIYGLVFAEAGDLWKDSSSIDFSKLKKSAGVGLRLYLPIIGQIGLDYGYGFDSVPSKPDKGKQGWNFTFSFGTAND